MPAFRRDQRAERIRQDREVRVTALHGTDLPLDRFLVVQPDLDAIREAAFNVVSIISTTGFTSHDFGQWGGFPAVLLLALMLVGTFTA